MRVTGSSCSWQVSMPGDKDYELECSEVHLLPYSCSVCDCGAQRLVRTERTEDTWRPPVDVEYMDTCYECGMLSSD